MQPFTENFEVFDIETAVYDGILKPLAISYSEKNEIYYRLIHPEDSLVEIIDSTFRDGVVYYAHNLLFDISFLLPIIIKNSTKFNWIFYNKKLYKINFQYRGKSIEMRCSLNILPFSLDKMYPDFSAERKLYFPYEVLQSWDPERLCSDFSSIDEVYKLYTLGDYLKVYSCTDSRILKESLNSLFMMLRQNGLHVTPKKSLTLGSIALFNYIKRFNNINLNLNSKHKTIIRNAYFGGRCEVFGNVYDNEKVLHFDFAGLYQKCMMESLPNDTYTLELDNLSIDRPGFYLIELESQSWLPVLPSRAFKLHFKCGKISGWFWYEEIQTALKNTECSNLKINAGLVATKYEPILADFVTSLGLIKSKTGLKSKIGKHLINSLYGRFAIKDEVEKADVVQETHSAQQFIPLGAEYRIQNSTIKRKKKSNIGVAAAIAAKGRKKLYEGFLEVLQAKGRLLYCDTDSIYAAFPKDLAIEDKPLGTHVIFSKKEKAIADAVFIAPKMYALLYEDGSEVVKLKGLGRETSFKDVKKLFYAPDRQTISYTILNKNQQNEYTYEKKQMQITPYDKRTWSVDKKTTEPKTNT